MNVPAFALSIVVLSFASLSYGANDQPPPLYTASIQSSSDAVNESDTSKRIILRAQELIGTPYKWGGTSEETGFDCSGLLVYLFRSEAGVELPRTTKVMINEGFPRIDRADLQPGDAVFFKHGDQGQVNHVGLYIGNNQFIHSPRTGKTIRTDSLDNRYWNERYFDSLRFTEESSS